MKKISLISIVLLTVSTTTFAGGLLTNTNQNIAFLRNPARDASIEIDAVYSNPAGLAFLAKDGFHISLNGQSAFQTRTITSSFKPFLMNTDGRTTGTDGSRVYKGEASAPFIPSVQAAYKRNNWTFSAGFAVTGGGGKATFNEGLGSFESQVALLPLALQQAGYNATQYSVDSYMRGKQYIFGLQLGATYKITDYLSAFVGARMNYVSNGTTIYDLFWLKDHYWNSKRKDKLIALNLPEPQSDEILEINKQIAYHMHSDKTVIIAKKNFRNIVSKMYPQLSYKDVNAVCNYILETYFENRIEDEFYSYQHRRYQEYFYTLSLYDLYKYNVGNLRKEQIFTNYELFDEFVLPYFEDRSDKEKQLPFSIEVRLFKTYMEKIHCGELMNQDISIYENSLMQ